MRYFLKIEDCDESGNPIGDALAVIGDGNYAEGKLVIGYLFDGAGYTLEVSGNCVRHERRSDVLMSLEFRHGELTYGSLRSGELNGQLPIYTHELKISVSEKGCSVRLVFSDGVQGGDKTVKNITARAVQ